MKASTRTSTSRSHLAITALAVLCLAHTASAAVITGASLTNLGNGIVNVGLTGLDDWHLYNSSVTTAPVTIYQQKAGGTLIGGLTATLDTGVVFAANDAWDILYTWTDGSPTAAATDDAPAEPRLTVASGGSPLSSTAANYSITVDGTTDTQIVTVYGGMRLTGVEVTASLTGAASRIGRAVPVQSGLYYAPAPACFPEAIPDVLFKTNLKGTP